MIVRYETPSRSAPHIPPFGGHGVLVALKWRQLTVAIAMSAVPLAVRSIGSPMERMRKSWDR